MACCPHIPCSEENGASRQESFRWGRNLLSEGVLAVVEGSSFDFGDVLSCWNSSTTRLGPSTAASTPSLRMPPVGGLGSRTFRHRFRCSAKRAVPFAESQVAHKTRSLKIALRTGCSGSRFFCYTGSIMFGDGSLTLREFAMGEPLPLARIRDTILEFLRNREDAVLFGAQAVNAYV